jgi:hypothetical protein
MTTDSSPEERDVTTTADTPSTEVEPVLAGALALLREHPDTTLEALAEQVAAAVPAVPAPEARPFPDLPRHVEMTEAALAALKLVPRIFNSVELASRRPLSQAEIDLLTREKEVLAAIGTVLAARDKAIGETMRVHMDADAEATGLAIPADKTGPDGTVIVAATPRDQNGHYLLAGPQAPHQVQSGAVAWSQEYSASAPAPSDGILQEAYQAGEISREDYLDVTREVRVFDTIKARDLIRRAPGRGLAVLRRITAGGKPKSSLYLRKVS